MVGTSAVAYIDLVSSTRYSGSVRGYIKVEETNGETVLHSLIVGIRNVGSGPQIYYEYDGSFEDVWSASYQMFYHFWISHDSTDIYTVHWGGTGTTYSASVQGAPGYSTLESFFAQSTSTNTTCNAMDYYFRSLSPWTTGQMGPVADSPYKLKTFSSTEFEGYGP